MQDNMKVEFGRPSDINSWMINVLWATDSFSGTIL